MAEIKPQIETFAKIKVVGVGGSGGSSVNRMIASKIRGVEFIAMNTDVQALHASQAQQKLHIGKSVTRGLGAGMDPEVGAKAAEESQNEIREMLKGADMVFITCGLGGGTGSGASPAIASMAREVGALTVAVVTKPFSFEGAARRAIADAAHEKLAANVDTIITIPNDRIMQMIDKKTSLLEAFETVDDVLRQGVQGISELITQHGHINVDFADVRAIMSNRGSALMGIGLGHGENRASDAAKAAIASPLLEVSIDGAKGILFAVTGGSNLSLFEVNEAAKIITESADSGVKVIFGTVIDESMKDEIKITVIATGFDGRTTTPTKPRLAFSGSMQESASPRSPASDVAARTIPVPSVQQQAVPAPVPRSLANDVAAQAAPEPAPEPLERVPMQPAVRTPYPPPQPMYNAYQASPNVQQQHHQQQQSYGAPLAQDPPRQVIQHVPAQQSAPIVQHDQEEDDAQAQPQQGYDYAPAPRSLASDVAESRPLSPQPIRQVVQPVASQPSYTPPKKAPVVADPQNEKEALDIPAFIRKKMM